MSRLNGWKTAALIFLTSFVGHSLAGSDKIDAKIDIVAILDTGRNDDATDRIKYAYQKLPTYFDLGPDKARLALVRNVVLGLEEVDAKFDDYQWILMDLSADRFLYEKTVENFTRSPVAESGLLHGVFWGRTFDVIRTRIFEKAPAGRAKVVVFIMASHGSMRLEDKAKAKTIREAGARLYIVGMNDSFLSAAANEMAGDSNRVVLRGTSEFDSNSSFFSAMDSIVEATHRDLCQWMSTCRFVDEEREQCQFEAWMPSPHPYTENVKQCDKFKPTNKTCDSEDCEGECDERWPWEKEPNCTDKCGVNDGKRRGPAPPKLENCPQWKTACPPCTTTSTSTSTPMTTTTSTSTSTTTPMNSTSTSTNAAALILTSATPTAVATTHMTTTVTSTPTTSTSTSDRTSIAPITNTSTTEVKATMNEFLKIPAAYVNEPTKNGSSEKDGASSLVIVIVAIVPFLLLIVLVAAVVVLKKRARRKKSQAAVKTEAKVENVLLIKEGPARNGALVSTGTRLGAETAVSADLSFSDSALEERKSKSAMAGKSNVDGSVSTKNAVLVRQKSAVKQGAGESVMTKGKNERSV